MQELPQDLVDRIVDDYLTGMPHWKICSLYGLRSTSLLYEILEAAGVPFVSKAGGRPQKEADDDIEGY
jgi:hypothetical protein